ncbi:MFS transporter [Micromonospora sp. NPDC050686]|uniref:MFS transporter n=1 Tax=Micromonospora sp. NPDC050686 TaxID=3154631 RepID=UPI0033E07272
MTLRFLRSNPAYSRLWLGQTLSTFGDTLYDVAVVWFFVSTTGSAMAASGVAIGAMVGALAGGLVAGAALDLYHPRHVMLISDAARFLGTLAVGLALLGGHASAHWVLYALAAAVSFCGAFFQPARVSATPALLSRGDLIRAGGMEGLGSGLASVLSWAASGAIVAFVGLPGVLLIDAGTFLVSLILVLTTTWTNAPGSVPAQGGSRFSVGVRWLLRDALTRRLIAVETVHALFSGLLYAALPLYVLALGGDAVLFGLQGGLSALSILVASIVLTRINSPRTGRIYGLGIAVNAVGAALMAAAPSAAPFLLGVLVAGLGIPLWTSGRLVIIQTRAPEAVRGRVFAVLDGAIHVALLPAWAGGAWLADTFGPRSMMLAVPVGYVLILLAVRHGGLSGYRIGPALAPSTLAGRTGSD